jgi:hypothetical protein
MNISEAEFPESLTDIKDVIGFDGAIHNPPSVFPAR